MNLSIEICINENKKACLVSFKQHQSTMFYLLSKHWLNFTIQLQFNLVYLFAYAVNSLFAWT